MASHYRIQEMADGVLIKSRRDADPWERLAGGAVAVMLVGVFGANIFRGWWWTILSGAAGAYAIRWGMNAQLLATNVEFVTSGDLIRRSKRHRIVCTGDVLRLEFRHEIVGGLYAVTARKGYCVLPFLDYEQTTEAIRAIETKFPGLAQRWHENSTTRGAPLFTSH